jgi:hypothetical protein
MSDDLGLRKPKGRSPSYPAIGLELAIQRARELYETERQHPTPASTVAHHWNYKSLNGPAAVTLAALKKFGLAEDEGSGDARRARVSDLAVDILAHPDVAQRQRAIKTAALEPSIHRELWERYGSSLPSDANLHWELTRDRGFTETGATEFIKEYKGTIAFARLDEHVESSTQESAAPAAAAVDKPASIATAWLERAADARSAVPEPRRSFPIPLISGGTVVVEGDFPLTEQDWAQFMAVLTAMKPGLVSGRDSHDSEAQDESEQN